MIRALLYVVLVWIGFTVGFIGGCWWNSVMHVCPPPDPQDDGQ